MIRSCTSLYLYITNIYNLLIHNNDSIFIINPRPSSLVYMYIQIHFLSLTFFYFSQQAYDQQKKKILRIPSGRFLDIYSWGFSIFKIRCRLIQEGTVFGKDATGKKPEHIFFSFSTLHTWKFLVQLLLYLLFNSICFFYRGGGQLLFFGPESFWRRYFVFYWFKGLSCSSLFMVLSDWFFFRSPFHDVIWLCLLILQTMC